MQAKFASNGQVNPFGVLTSGGSLREFSSDAKHRLDARERTDGKVRRATNEKRDGKGQGATKGIIAERA